MATSISVPFDLPSAHTLNEIPRRAFQFLHALRTQVNVRTAMKAHGYTREDHLEGWRMLQEVSNMRAPGPMFVRLAATDALAERD
jgi:hypothetical protein